MSEAVETSRSPFAAINDSDLSPAMRQYVAFKRQYPDYILFFRMGDFYEMFWEDAKTCGRVLGLTVTSRDKNSESPCRWRACRFTPSRATSAA